MLWWQPNEETDLESTVEFMGEFKRTSWEADSSCDEVHHLNGWGH